METRLELPLRSDALPEYTDYRDSGCDLYSSCLSCPLPTCRYDVEGGASAILRSGRDANILAAASDGSMSIDELARAFGLSRRTIFRVLRRQPDRPRRR
ncbi:MAG TPA: helix-turn-helix domain-containing protein [Tepidiformaceae bacterium]|nr:helix-turn-helix domain-containing protein [Tepidiformaceae bacterium]